MLTSYNAKSITTWTSILILLGHFGTHPCELEWRLTWTIVV